MLYWDCSFKEDGPQWQKILTVVSAAAIFIVGAIEVSWLFKLSTVHVSIACLPAIIYIINFLIVGPIGVRSSVKVFPERSTRKKDKDSK